MTRFMGFCVGLGAGFTVGLLSAPGSGEETRTRLQNKADRGMRYVRRRSRQIQRDVTRLKQQGTRMVTGPSEVVKAAVTAGKRAYLRVAG